MGKASKNVAVEGKESVKVYKWDGTAVKNALDDAVKEVMIDKLPYKESFSLVDGRLWICGVAVLVAMFALAWDFLHPFPRSSPVLLACVATYFALMGVLSLYVQYRECGIFALLQKADPAGTLDISHQPSLHGFSHQSSFVA